MSKPENKACARRILFLVLLAVGMCSVDTSAQTVPPQTVLRDEPEKLVSLNFRDAPLDQVLDFYSDLTGRTMIKAPGVDAVITLRSQTRLSETEALQAIESVLAMHDVALVAMGDKFLRVVQPEAVRREGLGIGFDLPEDPLPEADRLVSQVINLSYMEIGEIQPVIQSMIHGYGKILPLERTNSLMVTDTASNIRRILEVISFVDRPVEIKEDILVRELNYAEAGEVANRLRELIADAEGRDPRPGTTTARQAAARPDTEAPRAPPGVIRPRRSEQTSPAVSVEPAEMLERGLIHGRVKIVADDRINTIFIISRPDNFGFFERIVDVLDRPVAPHIISKVISLEYANAEDLAIILNEFVGAVADDNPGRPARDNTGNNRDARAAALGELADARSERLQEMVGEDRDRFGRLSPLTQILPDARTNSLLLMGRRSDIAALEEIIDQLDVMLGQVLIEAVILEVNLSDSLDYGISWLQRSIEIVSEQRAGPGGGVRITEPVAAFGGGFAGRPDADRLFFRDGAEIGRDVGLSPGALTYYATVNGLNLDAIIRVAASTGDARVLSTPVIMTTDNTEARIVVGEQRPVITQTATSTIGDRTVSSFEYMDIGINLTVTPRINPQRLVVMDISQSADDVVGTVTIDGNEVPIIIKREFDASVSVASRSTIALGGLVRTDDRMTRTKVPLLGDIPLLGALFRYDSMEERRTELIVLLTPYVVMTPEEAREETRRLHHHSESSRTEWHRGWSDSELAYPPDSERVYYPFSSPDLMEPSLRRQETLRSDGKLPPDALYQMNLDEIPEDAIIEEEDNPEQIVPELSDPPGLPQSNPENGDIFSPVPAR